jgi:amino acid permease
MRQIISGNVISKKMDLAIFVFILIFILLFPYLITPKQPKIIIHKAINHNQYNIIIYSKVHFSRIISNRKLFADIWTDNAKINSYYLSSLDAVDNYNERIKDVTISSQTNKIMVEFVFPENSISRTGVDAYPIE